MGKACFFKIRIDRGEGRYKWLGDGHGEIFHTSEKFALYFTSETVKCPEIQDFLREKKYEFIPTDDKPRFDWQIYVPANDTVIDKHGNSLSQEEIINLPIEDLELSVRTFNSLKRAGINIVREFLSPNPDMMGVRNLGIKSVEEVINKLRELGYNGFEKDSEKNNYPGREKCNQLRELRIKIAKANNIDFTPSDCNHIGPCSGTCSVCEAEAEYLDKELDKKQKLGEEIIIVGIADSTTEESKSYFSDTMKKTEVDNPSFCNDFDIQEDNMESDDTGWMGMDDDMPMISVRTYNCLKRAGINSLSELANMTSDDMMKVRNLGRKTLEELITEMKRVGITFRDSI